MRALLPTSAHAPAKAARWKCWVATLLVVAFVLPHGFASAHTVVVYTSTDQEYGEVILKEAQAALGQEIRAVFDAEAAKTVGLERRLVAEKSRPRADLFWNSEFLRTYRLQRQGVLLTPAKVDRSFTLPSGIASSIGVAFGIRGRVLVAHSPSVAEPDRPKALEDLTNKRWKGKVAIARPLFGTTSTHFAALHARWGAAKYVEFLKGLKANEVMVLPGNGDVRDAVAAGRALVGLTDTDDAVAALRRGQPLTMILPDQEDGGMFGVYMTVAQVAGGPNAVAASRLVEYLASERNEARLIELGAVQIPVRPHLPMAREMGPSRPKMWFMDPATVDSSLQPSAELIRKHLL